MNPCRPIEVCLEEGINIYNIYSSIFDYGSVVIWHRFDLLHQVLSDHLEVRIWEAIITRVIRINRYLLDAAYRYAGASLLAYRVPAYQRVAGQKVHVRATLRFPQVPRAGMGFH